MSSFGGIENSWVVVHFERARRSGRDLSLASGRRRQSAAQPAAPDVSAGETEEDAGSGGGNADAERVLLRMRQKLEGYEEGDLRSVEGQASAG